MFQHVRNAFGLRELIWRSDFEVGLACVPDRRDSDQNGSNESGEERKEAGEGRERTKRSLVFFLLGKCEHSTCQEKMTG